MALASCMQRLLERGGEVGQQVAEVDKLASDRVLALMEHVEDPVMRQLAVEMVPRQARRRGGDQEPFTLFDLMRGYTRRVPMAKTVLTKPDVCLYLTCVMVDALARLGKQLVVPELLLEGLVSKDEREWEAYKMDLAGRNYEALGSLGSHGAAPKPAVSTMEELRKG